MCNLGVAPRVMVIGPLLAIPMVLKNAGITQDDADLFEIAFGHPLDKSLFQIGLHALTSMRHMYVALVPAR